jgi:chromosome segregation ATPase
LAAALVVDEAHPLADLTDDNLHSFLRRISGAESLESERNRVQQAIEKQKQKLKAALEKKQSLAEQMPQDTAVLAEREVSLKEELTAKEEKLQLTKKLAEPQQEELRRQVARIKADLDATKSELSRLLSERAKLVAVVKEAKKAKDEKIDLRKLKESKRQLDALIQAHTKLMLIFSSYTELLDITADNGEVAERVEVGLEACPICQLFSSVKCNLKHISLSARGKTVSRALEIERSKREKISKEREHELTGFETLDDRLKDIDTKLREDREAAHKLNSEIQATENEVKELTDVYIKSRRHLTEISEGQTREFDVDSLKTEIEKLREQRHAALAKKKEYADAADEVTKCENQLRKLEDGLAQTRAKLRKVLDDARLKFNTEAATIMKEIGLKGFRNLSMDEGFHAVIVRIKEGREFNEKLGELSSSEAAATRVLIAFAAKQAYLPEAPIFMIDTITTALDAERFTRLLEYLRDKIPFLIATSLDPRKEQITVVHSAR